MITIDKGSGYFKAGNTRYAASSLYYYIDSNGVLFVRKNNDKSIGIEGVLYSEVKDKLTDTFFTSPADLESYMDSSGVGVNPAGGSGGGGGGTGTSDASAANQVTGNTLLTNIRNNQTAGPKTAATSQSVTPATDAVFNTAINNLPANPSTSTLQTAGNTSLNNIDTKVATSANQGTAIDRLTSIRDKQISGPSTSATSQSVVFATDATSPLPNGGSTSALQTTGNTTLTSIDGKLNKGQGTKAQSLSITIASDQGTIITADENIGTKADTASTTTTGSQSAISLLKGIWNLLLNLAGVATEINTTITVSAAATVTVLSVAVPAGRNVRVNNLSGDIIWVSTTNATPSPTANECFPLSGSTSGIGGVYEPAKRITNAIYIYNVAANARILLTTW